MKQQNQLALGLELGSAQPLPQLILGPLRDSTCLVKCLRGLVRAKVPAPNAPKGPCIDTLSDYGPAAGRESCTDKTFCQRHGVLSGFVSTPFTGGYYP